MGNDQKRVFLAVVLSAVVLFGWQFFFGKKVDPKTSFQQETVEQVATTDIKSGKVVVKPFIEKLEDLKELSLENEGYNFSWDNSLNLKNIISPDAKFTFSSAVGKKGSFQIALNHGSKALPLTFDLEKRGDKLIGENKEYGVSFEGTISPKGQFEFSLDSAEPLSYAFIFESESAESEEHSMRGFNRNRSFTFLSKGLEKLPIGEADEGTGFFEWMGIDFDYHLFALSLKNKPNLSYQSMAEGVFLTKTLSPVQKIEGSLVFTRKNYDKLVGLGGNLKLAVDFGYFSVIAVPILRGLQFFYGLVGNYGIAIILLTLLIRLLIFPLNYKSLKSMKKMQSVQPQLQKIRERYKDNPQKMQQESMALFKKAGANPLGGCLPMILQLPIFFAFYRVLYEAVELVNAPFFGWVHDLSVKDPYYVLPVLMGVSMFLQQKMTPSQTVDPNQKKIMMIIPLVFTFFMKDLPAGLNLYIFVSTLFGIGQQIFVNKRTV